jgi:hypothetical protein
MATNPTDNIFGGGQMVNKQEPVSSTNIFGGPSARSYTATTSGNIFGGPNAVVRPSAPTPVVPAPIPAKQKFQFKNPLMAIGETIEKATSRPDYDKKPASTSAWKNILREFPAALIETILPGVRAMRDMPEEFTDITVMDLVKEVPGATGEVAKALAQSAVSYPLTFYGATSQYVTEPLGLGKAPGVSEDGRVRLNIPILGSTTNIQERIFTDKEGKDPASNLRTGFDVARYTGEELLNGLFTASLASNIVNPRISPVTKKGTVNVVDGSTKNMGPKSFRLYEPKVMRSPIDDTTFQKIVADNKIAVNSKYNPKLPTYFEYTGTSGSTLKGRFVQVKESYFKTFVNTFKGDPTKVPVSELIPVANTTKEMANLAVKNITAGPVVPPVTSVTPAVENIFKDSPKITPVAESPVIKAEIAKQKVRLEEARVKMIDKLVGKGYNRAGLEALDEGKLGKVWNESLTETPKPTETPKVEAPVKKVVDSLTTEARKYKTEGKGEEEFLMRETRGLFHATDEYSAQSINQNGFTLGNESTSRLGAKDKMLGDGIYFGKSRSAVSQYGESVIEARIPKNLNIKDITPEELLKAYQDNGWQITKTDPAEVSNYFKKLGYDGLRTPRETVIFDPKNIKTRTQIEDIWNKANKKIPTPEIIPENNLISEAKKYKSAEEFVKAQGTPIYHHGATELENKGGTWFTNNDISAGGARAGAKGRIDAVIDESGLKLANNKQATEAGLYRSKEEMIANLKAQGFDGVKHTVDGDKHYMIFDESNIKTKPQLTDIWNKAQGGGLTLKPSEAKTQKEIATELDKTFGEKTSESALFRVPGAKVVKGEIKLTPLVNKTDIKTIIDRSPEFKANPTLTVDVDKNLTFKGDKQEFKIKASALGLNADNLTKGDKIDVDTESLTAKGAEQQLRVYKNGKSYASIGKFRDGTPLLQGGIENVKPVQLPEMVQLAKDLMGEAPKIRTKIGRKDTTMGVFKPVGNGKISLRADLFDGDVNSIDQAAKTLAHEIGHLVDYLPEGTLKRGNLVGRLNTLKGFQKDFYEPMGVTRSDPEFKKQLWELSQYWRPLDVESSSPSFLEYRKSAPELYADFLSALLNDPKLVQKMAPASYNVFFEQLDKKPAVRDAYFELQSLLSGDPSTLTAARRAGVKQMFQEGDYKASELQAREGAEKKLRLSSLFFKLKFDLVSKNYKAIDQVRQLEKKGVVISPDDNPVYYLEEKNYLGGRIKAIMAQDFDPIYKRLIDSGIPWNEFGEALFYKRIVDGDRSKVANPRGITPDVAKGLLDDVKNKLGDKLPVLEESLKDFQEALMKRAEEAYTEGLYTKEMYDDMKKNPTYATFQVLDYLENGLTSKVYKSIGTLKDITNPATASIEKMIKTVQAIEQNRANRKMVDFQNENFPDEIKPATKVFTGKGHRFIESKKDDEELVTLLRNGKLEGYYVDPYIAKSLSNESVGANLAAVQALRFMNSNLYRPLFITYSLGFQSFNLIRDFTRFWKNMPDTGFFESLNLYRKAVRPAKIRAFGLPKNPTPADIEATKLIESLEMQKILSVTMNDMLIGKGGEETQIELLFDKYGINPLDGAKQNVVIGAAKKILEFIRQTGDLIETLPKVAGYNKLTSKGPITKADASFIRRSIGSPDFQDGGYAKPISNEVFLFSNSIIQGIRSDLEIATNPKTRSGYWYKTAKINFIPKILMWLASIGAAGAGIKGMMDDVSEYDKTNYNIIPLGRDKNNKTVYLRVPQDETGRLLSAMLWKTMNMSNNDQSFGRDASDIFTLLGGQIPSVTPTINLISTTGQYLSGQNPYDYFRGRNVMTDDVFAAGGSEAAKAFWGWQFQQIGGGVFGNLFNGSKTPVDKSIPEKIVSIPIASNILGRFIKVSNYGRTEMFNQIQEQYAQVDAKRRLEEKEVARTYAEKVVTGEMTAVEANNQMLTERFGGEPQTEDDFKAAQRLQNRFNLNLKLGKQDPTINALIYARQNQEKAAILAKVKETMEISLFKSLIEAMYSDKIINDEVIDELQEMLNKE